MTAWYNEIDPYAAQWLRNLIAAGHIAPGVVDERSIEDVTPADLAPFTQCHFFAGIGVWSYALRAAGWPDDRPVWSGSCPCQPFSAAGKGNGFTDPRHLWPVWEYLIRECEPPNLFGEQVASKDADPWIDLVQANLETLDYAFGAVAFPSAGVGAPHIRDRTYWLAHSTSIGCPGRGKRNGGEEPVEGDSPAFRRRVRKQIAERSSISNYWANATWLESFDDRSRPTQPGIFPLASGSTADMVRVRADQGNRQGRLKGYGNAINAEAAITFIDCAMSSLGYK